MSDRVLAKAKCIKKFDAYSDGYTVFKIGDEVLLTDGLNTEYAILCNGIIDIYNVDAYFEITEQCQ
jgi:hypothetical protein